MSIFGNLFRGDDLKQKKAQFEEVNERYIKEGVSISADSIELYECRKNSIRQLQRVKSYVEMLNNCPEDIIKGAVKALSYTDKFNEAVSWEIGVEHDALSMQSDSNSNTSKIGIGGMAAGAAIATMGPTAAMALATTFGTASTGVAISSLGGIAATNAALAWLGGGAIAAGGAGVAGGSALLALAGPIGWGVAGIAALGTTFKLRSSNSKAIDEIDNVINELDNKMRVLEPKHEKLRNLIATTMKLNDEIEIDRFLGCPNDYNNDDYPKDVLIEMVNLCKTTGKLINDTIQMKMM